MTHDGDRPGGNAADGDRHAAASPSAAPGKVKDGARRRDLVVGAAAGAAAALMVGAAYAAVPLYSWFCRTTGYGGIPQVAHVAPDHVSDRKINVRFDANVGSGLPWRFEPEQNSIELQLGQVVTVYYTASNLSDQETDAQAAYNVAPSTAGSYFVKINCFCFSEQHFAPREKRQMAVVFYVAPDMVKDSDQDDLNNITLSYTFYPAREPSRKGGVAESTSRAGAEQKKI